MSVRLPQPLSWVAELRPATHGAVAADDAALLDFSANGNVLGPSPRVAAAIGRVDPAIYPDREARALRAALAELHGVPADMVVVGNGSTELIWALARAYLAVGHCALVIGPTYGEYAVASAATGATVVNGWIAPPGERFDARGLVATLREVAPTLVWLCNPNNPTGAALPPGVVADVLAAAPDALVAIDEAYLSLAEDVASAIPQAANGRIVVLRSLTKDAGLAGLRVGYTVADPRIAEVLRRMLPPWSVSSVAQVAALAALEDGAHREQVLVAVAESRAHLETGLRRLELAPLPSVANFVLVAVGDGAAIASRLRERGIAVRDCASFGLPTCIRIGVRAIADQECLLAALGEVLDG
ncbi:MAG: histidinol-phosphate aminotransferase [Chloroflexota bacterium]|jgi:histidinol-phosphate aminotransferase|nr:histidinol-phosphate aminotransferase [Chloroflexota bacterium]